MKFFYTLLTFLPVVVLGQTKIAFSSACSYYGEKIPNEIYSFSSDSEAQISLTKITSASGLPANFKLVAGNVPNACATLKWNPASKGYDRYIIYNQTFMLRLKNSTNDWAALSILAHEVGHHLSGHSLIAGGSKPELELEADKFSGFILAKLGAELNQAQTAINSLVSENYSTTHPPKSARLAAIANGWINATGNNNANNQRTIVNSTLSNVRPSSNEININTIKWKKNANGGFSIYFKPTGYYFKNDIDYIYAPLRNGNYLIYLKSNNCYWELPDYTSAYQDVENELEIITCQDAVFVRSKEGNFWILDKGKYVSGLEYLGNSNQNQLAYRCQSTGKRYWIPYNDMYYATFNKPKGIYSE